MRKKLFIYFLIIVCLTINISLISATAWKVGHAPSAYYKCNEAIGVGGNASDSSGNNLHLQNQSAKTNFNIGKLGNSCNSTAIIASATGWSSVSGNNAFAFGENNFTVAFWLKQNDDSGGLGDTILGTVGDTGGWTTLIIADGKVYFGAHAVGVLGSTSNVTNNIWNRIVFVRTGLGTNQFKVYVNGIQENQGTLADNLNNVNYNFSMDPIYQYQTHLDDIGIWNNYAFTPTDIINDYNSGNGREQDGIDVKLLAPANNYISSTIAIQFNCSASTSNAITNISLWTNSTGTWKLNQTNSTLNPLTNTSSFNLNLGNSTLWTCQACEIGGTCSFGSNRTININTAPIIFNLLYPPSVANITIDFGYVGQNISLNYSITDTSIDTCWYNYNLTTNITIPCTSNSTLILTSLKSITLYANDSSGKIGSEIFNWSYKIFVDSPTYNLDATETTIENFTINITYDSSEWSAISANLIYNGVSYSGTKIGSGNNIKFLRSVVIPSGNLSYQFYWRFALTDISGTTYYNSTNYNQTISTLLFTPCNATYKMLSVNFTLKEEGSFTLINGSLEINGYYGSGAATKAFSYTNITSNLTNFQFCINPNYTSMLLTATTSYYSTNYDRREYFFSNAVINNQTQNVNLYLASTATTDIVTFRVIDENDQNVVGAKVYVDRWDIGTNNYYTVGMLQTGDDGKGIINLRLNDAWYRFQVIYNGKVYLTTSAEKITGVAGSEILKTLRIFITQVAPYSHFSTIDYSLTYNNNTKTFLMTWADTSGSVDTGCLRVSKIGVINQTQYYYSCIQSTGGSLSYTISENGTYIASAEFKLSSSYNSISEAVKQIMVTLGVPKRFLEINQFGRAAGMLLIGTLGMIGVASGSIILGVALVTAGAVICNLLGLINFTQTVLYAIGGLALVIGITAARKYG